MAHQHSHHEHSHHSGHRASERRLLLTLAILLSFTAIEFLGGWFANSLALLAESGHMLADSGSLMLAIIALRAGRRPADSQHTYGSARYQTLAAYTNGLTLLALTLWVMAEAIQRLIAPPPVNGLLMLVVALLGGAANLTAFITLSGGRSLNERGARAHVLSDLLGSAAATCAAVLILEWNWRLADPILSVLVSLLILRSGWHLTHEASHVLLQGTPFAVDPDGLARDLTHVRGVRGVHHLHIWSMTGDAPVVTLHAAIDTVADHRSVLRGIMRRLRDHHSITDATVQLEDGECPNSGGDHCYRP